MKPTDYLPSASEEELAALEPFDWNSALRPGSRMAVEPVQEPNIIVDQLLYEGQMMLLGGGAKSFKTFAMIQLGLAAAWGKTWWGFDVGEPIKVIYCDFELARWEFHRRLQKIFNAMEASGREIPKFRFDHLELRDKNLSAGDPAVLDSLGEFIQDGGYQLVLFEPLYLALGDADSNAESDMVKVYNNLRRLAMHSQSCLVLAAHFNKSTGDVLNHFDRIAGSAVSSRYPETLVTINRKTKQYQPEEGPDRFDIEISARSFAPIKPFECEWNYPLIDRAPHREPSALEVLGKFGVAVLEVIREDGSLTAAAVLKRTKVKFASMTAVRVDAELEKLEENGLVVFDSKKNVWKVKI